MLLNYSRGVSERSGVEDSGCCGLVMLLMFIGAMAIVLWLFVLNTVEHRNEYFADFLNHLGKEWGWWAALAGVILLIALLVGGRRRA